MSANIESFVMAQGGEQPWWGTAGQIDAQAGLDQWMEQAGLNWRVCEMPVLIQGKAENRKAEGWKALVRSTDAAVLGMVTTDYKVHQNRDLVEVFRNFTEAGELVMDTMGSLCGGKKVFAAAKVNGDIAIRTPKGTDVHKMFFLLSTGHTGGYATQADLTDVRVVCNNTLSMARDAAATKDTRWRMSHLGRWSSARASEVKALVDRALGKKATLVGEWEKLYSAPALPIVEALLYTELFQPELFQKVTEKVAGGTMQIGSFHVRTPNMDAVEKAPRLSTLDALVNDADARRTVVTELLNPNKFNRTVNTLMGVSTSQKGASLSVGTVANAVNAITSWTDHDRGRNADSAADSALFGQGRNDKAQAMTLGLQYAQDMVQIAGRTLALAN